MISGLLVAILCCGAYCKYGSQLNRSLKKSIQFTVPLSGKENRSKTCRHYNVISHDTAISIRKEDLLLI